VEIGLNFESFTMSFIKKNFFKIIALILCFLLLNKKLKLNLDNLLINYMYEI